MFTSCVLSGIDKNKLTYPYNTCIKLGRVLKISLRHLLNTVV